MALHRLLGGKTLPGGQVCSNCVLACAHVKTSVPIEGSHTCLFHARSNTSDEGLFAYLQYCYPSCPFASIMMIAKLLEYVLYTKNAKHEAYGAGRVTFMVFVLVHVATAVTRLFSRRNREQHKFEWTAIKSIGCVRLQNLKYNDRY